MKEGVMGTEAGDGGKTSPSPGFEHTYSPISSYLIYSFYQNALKEKEFYVAARN